jgi:hypothetical protein
MGSTLVHTKRMSIDIGAERTADIDQLTDQLAIEIEELDTEILAAVTRRAADQRAIAVPLPSNGHLLEPVHAGAGHVERGAHREPALSGPRRRPHKSASGLGGNTANLFCDSASRNSAGPAHQDRPPPVTRSPCALLT